MYIPPCRGTIVSLHPEGVVMLEDGERALNNYRTARDVPCWALRSALVGSQRQKRVGPVPEVAQQPGPVGGGARRPEAAPLPCGRLTSSLDPQAPRHGQPYLGGSECRLRSRQGSEDEPDGEVSGPEDRPLVTHSLLPWRIEHWRVPNSVRPLMRQGPKRAQAMFARFYIVSTDTSGRLMRSKCCNSRRQDSWP
jgi:hypothetical protein